MVGDITKQDRTPLLPLRHAQGDFFVCDIFDAAPKGDMASMAHPIFTLSTKPDTKKRRYVATDGKSYVEVRPNMIGLATVHDRDVLIYCISQVMAALNDGKQVHRTLRFKAYDLLVATNRPVAEPATPVSKPRWSGYREPRSRRTSPQAVWNRLTASA